MQPNLLQKMKSLRQQHHRIHKQCVLSCIHSRYNCASAAGSNTFSTSHKAPPHHVLSQCNCCCCYCVL